VTVKDLYRSVREPRKKAVDCGGEEMNIRMRNVSDDNARDKVAVLGAYLINAIFNFSRGDLKAAAALILW
jgi:hypothetical protein